MLLTLLMPLILIQFVRILLLNFLVYLSSPVILKHLQLSLHFLKVCAYEHISFRYPCCAFLNDVESAELHHYHCLELKLKVPKVLYNPLYAKKLLSYLAYQDYVLYCRLLVEYPNWLDGLYPSSFIQAQLLKILFHLWQWKLLNWLFSLFFNLNYLWQHILFLKHMDK